MSGKLFLLSLIACQLSLLDACSLKIIALLLHGNDFFLIFPQQTIQVLFIRWLYMVKPLAALLFFLILTFYSNLIHWLESHLLTCYVKGLTGMDCPGCGLQRSVIALLRGDVASSWHIYPAAMPMLALFGFTFVHIRFQFSWGAMLIKFGYVAVVVLILINYIFKIKNNQLY